MASLVGIDIIFLLVWTVVDPMARVVEEFDTELPDLEDSDEDYEILPYLEHCESSYNFIWLGIAFTDREKRNNDIEYAFRVSFISYRDHL